MFSYEELDLNIFVKRCAFKEERQLDFYLKDGSLRKRVQIVSYCLDIQVSMNQICN